MEDFLKSRGWWVFGLVLVLACAPAGAQTSVRAKKAAAAQAAKAKAKAPAGKPGGGRATAASHAHVPATKAGKAVTSKSAPRDRNGHLTTSHPVHGSSRGSRYAYRTGHGDRGYGTLHAPPRYTAPLPPPAVLQETAPAPVVPTPRASAPVASEPAVPVPVAPVVSGAAAIENASQLNGFFGHLQKLQAGDATETTRVLQFGDSHTAADMFTGRMRSLLQVHFGNGGAGFTFAGHPFAGYRILGTSRSQTSGWVAEGVHFTQMVDTRLGLGGVANTAMRANEEITLDAPCTKMELQYEDQPSGGGFSLLEDGVTLSTTSTDNTTAPETLTATCTPNAVHRFEVVTDSSRPVRLLGFVTEQPGITYEAIGLNGAEAGLILRWDQPMFEGYLRERDPALIVLAYGTNEAGNKNWTYEAYRDLLGRIVDKLHATVPAASILVLGPPDRSVRSGYGTRRHPAAWVPYDNTLHITSAQREVCRTHGCAFWSWRDRMGGLGSMNRWVADGLAQPDHVHFTSSGYVALADFLYSDILSAYDVWKAGNDAVSRVTTKGGLQRPRGTGNRSHDDH